MSDADVPPANRPRGRRFTALLRSFGAFAACTACALALLPFLSRPSDGATERGDGAVTVAPGIEGSAEHTFATLVWHVGTEGAAEHARLR